jgi:hypothetical protein
MSSKLAFSSNFCKHLVLAGVAAAALASSLSAQEGTTSSPKIVSGEGPLEAPPPGPFFFATANIGAIEGKVVTGAPYSATEITTLTQTLANGTHIVQKQEASTARDSEGRTRREQSVTNIGPWSTADRKPLVFINDPVAKVHYVLEPDGNTVIKSTAGNAAFVTADGGGVVGINRGMASIRTDGPVTGPGPITIGAEMAVPAPPPPGAATMSVARIEKDDAKVETLQSQMIEGVKAEGKRTTRTIAAGTMGNDQDIVITSEVWYSPELQTVVLLKRSDPRVGDSVMSLTNIQRTEPDPSLFQVPAGYTVKDAESMIRTKIVPDNAQQPQAK